MRFEPTVVAGVVVIEPERRVDERGFFARTWCAEEFAAVGLPDRFVQSSVSWNEHRHTLRGMHWQAEPHGEGKLVRCTRGAVFDVLVDLRPDSATFCRWQGFELRADGVVSLFIPAGFAHGFQTLEDASEVHYQMTYHYVPEAARGVRWDDPAFRIAWPEPPPGGRTMSERDASYPDFRP